MNFELKGRHALVLSASKGIGFGVAEALAAEGCTLSIASSNRERIAEAASILRARYGIDVAPVVLDIRSTNGFNAGISEVQATRPSVDIVVTNVPGPPPLMLEELKDDQCASWIESNLLRVISLCQAFLPGMKQRGHGRLVHLTSTTAKEPDESMVLSNVTRAGLSAYSKTVAREYGKYGITSNVILTGSVMTDRARDLLKREASAEGVSEAEMTQRAALSVPVGRISSPEEFAAAVVFLASARASYVNGVALPVDGGVMRSL